MLELPMVFAQMDAGFSIIWLLIVGIMALFSFACFAVWLWALIHAIGNTSLDSTMKVVWILVIIFTAPIGPVIYLLIGRK